MNAALTTLSEIAVTRPGATRVFQAHRLDFCCHGQRNLADACAERGLDVASVLREIDAAEPDAVDLTALARKPLADVLAFIQTRYHEELRRELPALVELSRKVERVHAEKATCPRGLTAHLEMMHEEVFDHLDKEDHVLFPLIAAGRGRMAGPPIQMMELEHEDHGRSLDKLRELATGFVAPEEACASWRALYARLDRLASDLVDHIHLENNVVFPRALGE
jgi:regulator of cell morphogenesis and NO signaling